MADREDLPDWCNASAYEPLFLAERPSFAWEWLRRQSSYRTEALRCGAGQHEALPGAIREDPRAALWGLHAFEDPRVTSPDARPIWRADRHPFVLVARAQPSAANRDAFVLDPLTRFATIVAAQGVERLLLSDGHRSIRLDVRGASLTGGPVRLHYEISGLQAAGCMVPVLRRFVALVSKHAFSRSLHPPDPRARRQILLLRTYDALQDGADQRTIAAALLSDRAIESRWRINAPSLRSQVQRLVQGARLMSGGRFWDLLL